MRNETGWCFLSLFCGERTGRVRCERAINSLQCTSSTVRTPCMAARCGGALFLVALSAVPPVWRRFRVLLFVRGERKRDEEKTV